MRRPLICRFGYRLLSTAAVALQLSTASTSALADPACGGTNPKACAASAVGAGELEKAYELLLPLATAGDAESQTALALLIANGHGASEARAASRDERQMLALPWIRRAAIGADPKATAWLADGYQHGWFGFQVNPVKEKCLRDAAVARRSSTTCLE